MKANPLRTGFLTLRQPYVQQKTRERSMPLKKSYLFFMNIIGETHSDFLRAVSFRRSTVWKVIMECGQQAMRDPLLLMLCQQFLLEKADGKISKSLLEKCRNWELS